MFSYNTKTWLQFVLFCILFSFLFIFINEKSFLSSSYDSFHRNLIGLGGHKDLFPLDSYDIWGTIFVVLGLLIAASGGIGGGGILVPLFILVFGFHAKYAVALSNFCILGSSIMNMYMNLSKRHPLTNRPLVDWDLILVMEPLTMAGAVIGAFLSKILPEWILTILLVILLAFTTQTTLEKGLKQYKNETKLKLELQKSDLLRVQLELEENDEEEETKPLIKTLNEIILEQEQNNIIDIENITTNELKNNILLNKLLYEESLTPWYKIKIIILLVSIVIILNLLKGGKGNFNSPLGIQCGSYLYWLLTLLVFIWILSVSYFIRNKLIKNYYYKKNINYQYLLGDIEWNEINTIKYPCICFFAGFCAGLFGIGGGIVKGPLMLYMGIHPQVASATCAVMIMFTSVAATTMFIAFGTLQWDYAIYFFIIGLIATIIGQFGVSILVNKTGRYSLISLSIGAVVSISTILMAIQSIFSLLDNNSTGTSGVCSD